LILPNISRKFHLIFPAKKITHCKGWPTRGPENENFDNLRAFFPPIFPGKCLKKPYIFAKLAQRTVQLGHACPWPLIHTAQLNR
jgi:hypothetical protein